MDHSCHCRIPSSTESEVSRTPLDLEETCPTGTVRSSLAHLYRKRIVSRTSGDSAAARGEGNRGDEPRSVSAAEYATNWIMNLTWDRRLAPTKPCAAREGGRRCGNDDDDNDDDGRRNAAAGGTVISAGVIVPLPPLEYESALIVGL